MISKGNICQEMRRRFSVREIGAASAAPEQACCGQPGLVEPFRIGASLLFPSAAPHFPERRWFLRGASAWKCGADALFRRLAPHLRCLSKSAAASQVSSKPSGSAPACFFPQARRIFRSRGGFRGEHLPGHAAQILCSRG